MSKRNPEYDFKWCPGCGDFGVRRAMEMALAEHIAKTGLPVENNVIVAGIGCSGNMVHLLEGPQPFGIHGVHGRTLPIAMGIKMARPELNVLIAAGDGDFLSIGLEHVGPAAQRNLNVTCIIMDNGVYGLTKGQSSPTTTLGTVTPSTPHGKVETPMNPLALYLTLGVSFIAQGISSQIKEMAKLIGAGMEHPGFAIIHIQSPCTTYNDNYDALKGNEKKGIAPAIWNVPADHDPEVFRAAYEITQAKGVPLGIIYRQLESEPFEQRVLRATQKVRPRSAQQLVDALQV